MSAVSQYEILDPHFRTLILMNVNAQKISSGHLWTEGPVWFNDHNVLLFSDIPNQRILRWTPCGSVTVFREQSNFANGHTRDREGRLVTCEHGTRSVTRTEHDGSITRLIDRYEGKRLNSPNDVVVKSDGSIWFTDPIYGIMNDFEGNKSVSEQEERHVYRLDVNSRIAQSVTMEFCQPNGLAFSVDERHLYVAESGRSDDESVASVVRVFDVVDGHKLANSRDFAVIEPGVPDGLRVDNQGNVWVAAADGVHCFAPCGTLLGKIYIPETVSNLAFGGLRNNQLFITATTSVYSIYVNTSSALTQNGSIEQKVG